MFENSTQQVRWIFKLAEEEARTFRHEYIGTEHLLLGLAREEAGVAATVLRSHGIDVAKIRHEIEQLVQYGCIEVMQENLPFTPRAGRAMEFAEEHARMVGQTLVDTEHLLLGLLREADGVAGIVLRNFGLDLSKLAAEILKFGLLQMKIVERVVRPLLAHIKRKRKIRDELLAHLSAIYDEEFAKSQDPDAAVAAASKRFGEPNELTMELQPTVPLLEQWGARLEPVFGWRPPETVARWMTRLAIQVGLVMVGMCALMTFLALREFGWNDNLWLTIRPIAAAAIAAGLIIAVSGICYFKIRDCIFGVFGSRKSWALAIVWAFLLTASTVASGLMFDIVAYGRLSAAIAAFYPWLATCVAWAISLLVFARVFGPQEIRDATWAMLDLNQ